MLSKKINAHQGGRSEKTKAVVEAGEGRKEGRRSSAVSLRKAGQSITDMKPAHGDGLLISLHERNRKCPAAEDL